MRYEIQYPISNMERNIKTSFFDIVFYCMKISCNENSAIILIWRVFFFYLQNCISWHFNFAVEASMCISQHFNFAVKTRKCNLKK